MNAKVDLKRSESQPKIGNAVISIMQRLQHIAKAHKRLNWVGVVLFIGASIADFSVDKSNRQSFWWVPMTIGLTWITQKSRVLRMQKDAVRALAQQEQTQTIGTFAELIEAEDKDTRRIAETALIRLLPQVEGGRIDALSKTQRKSLYHALVGNNVQLVVSILQSLMHWGDSSMLPYVKALADGKFLAAKSKCVQDIAIDCLPSLQELARQQQASHTLLHPASSPASPIDVLLRPSVGTTRGAPASLLRATMIDEP